MRKLLSFLFVFLTFLSMHGMQQQQSKQNKRQTIEWVVKVPTPTKIFEKSVLIVTPTTMSKAKAERFFAKNTKDLEKKVARLIKLCGTLLYQNDAGVVHYSENPILAHVNNDLLHMVENPCSFFIYLSDEQKLVIERPLVGDRQDWYFTEFMEIIPCDTLPHGGACSLLTVQCHNDKVQFHDKILVSELERFAQQSNLPDIIIDEGQAIDLEKEKKDAALIVSTIEEKRCLLALLFLKTHPKHKHLFPK